MSQNIEFLSLGFPVRPFGQMAAARGPVDPTDFKGVYRLGLPRQD